VVDRTGARPTVSGFFLGRGGGDVHMAVIPDENSRMAGDDELSVLTIPKDQVESVVIGAPVEVGAGTVRGERRDDPPVVTQLPPPRGPTIVVAPTDPDRPPGDPPPPPEEEAPRVVPSRLQVEADREGGFTVPLSAPTEPASVLVKLFVYDRAKRREAVGRWRVRLVRGSGVDIPMRLDREWVTRLERRGRLVARASLIATGEGGESVVHSRLVIRPARP
jgi:hypothetical protein